MSVLSKWFEKAEDVVGKYKDILYPLFREVSELDGYKKSQKIEYVLDKIVGTPLADELGLDTDFEKDIARFVIKVGFMLWRWGESKLKEQHDQ